MTIDPNAWLMGSGAPSARFDQPGDTVTGRIVSVPELRQQTDFTSGKPLFWENGDPRMQLVVTLSTDLRDPQVADDDGTRRVYVKGQLQKVVQQAVRLAQAPGLEVGGTLTVTYTGDGEAKQRGMNPPKLYAATYQRATETFLAQPEPAPAPVAQPVAPVAPVPAAPVAAAPQVDAGAAAAAVGQLSEADKARMLAQLGITVPPAA